MRQLVELKEHALEFKNLNAELVFVYREESEGVDGLKKIKDKHDPPFRLALDYEKKSSKAYSPESMTFDNYVVDSKQVVQGIVSGTLRERAKPQELIEMLKGLQVDRE